MKKEKKYGEMPHTYNSALSLKQWQYQAKSAMFTQRLPIPLRYVLNKQKHMSTQKPACQCLLWLYSQQPRAKKQMCFTWWKDKLLSNRKQTTVRHTATWVTSGRAAHWPCPYDTLGKGTLQDRDQISGCQGLQMGEGEWLQGT
jgi:hypothetical protein